MSVVTAKLTKNFVAHSSDSQYFERRIHDYFPGGSSDRSDFVNDGDHRLSDSQAFMEGVHFGRRLQREEDRQTLSRYCEDSYIFKAKYEEEVLLRERSRTEAEISREELSQIKCQLLAAQLVYEELALSYAKIRSSMPQCSGLPVNHDQELESNSRAIPMNETLDSSESYTYELDSPMSPSVDAIEMGEFEENFDALQQVQLIEELGVDYVEQLGFSQWIDEPRYEKHALVREREVTPLTTMLSPGVRTSESILSGSATSRSRARASSTIMSSKTNPSEIFVDASGRGIGFIFGDKWLAWRFPAHHPLLPLGPDGKLVMSWAELVAVELGVRALLAAGYRNSTLIVRSDNAGVVKALKDKKWITKYGLHDVLQRIFALCDEGKLWLQMKWVSTKANLADGPSRRVYPSNTLLFQHRPEIPMELADIIEDVLV
jgi:hypothetical protein